MTGRRLADSACKIAGLGLLGRTSLEYAADFCKGKGERGGVWGVFGVDQRVFDDITT